MTSIHDRALGPAPETMRAIAYDRYGNADEMALRESPVPEPKQDEVRIRIHATSLNSWDWDLLHGTALVRPFSLFRPKHRILGCDVAGRVERVGERVTGLAVGDDVFGDLSGASWGGFAEYACAPAQLLARKPATMSFEQAAAIPQAGVLALQGLRMFGPLDATRRILILGAGGGVGTFALQLAKAQGAHVAVVDHATKLAALRELGADEVIDAARDDFSAGPPRFDAILDVVGKRPPRESLRVLSPNGRYVMVGGTVGNLLRSLFLAMTPRSRVRILAHEPNREDLDALAHRFEQGAMRPVIGRVCGLAEVPETLERLGAGEIVGKAVMSFAARGSAA